MTGRFMLLDRLSSCVLSATTRSVTKCCTMPSSSLPLLALALGCAPISQLRSPSEESKVETTLSNAGSVSRYVTVWRVLCSA